MTSKSKTVLDIAIGYEKCQDDIDRVMDGAKKNGLKEQRNSFPLRPSGALKPDLDLYLELVNYYKPGTIPRNKMDGRVYILLESGHVLEDFIVEQYNRVHKVTSTNQKVMYGTVKEPDGKIRELSGEYDLTFIDTETGEEMLGDSKTSADFAFKMSKPASMNPAFPKEEHIAQLNLYMHSKEFKDKGIKKARIIYYNKNNSDYDVYQFEYSEELALKTLLRFQRIMDMYIAGTPPKQEYYWGAHWKANYGSFRSYLHKDYKPKKEERNVIKVTDQEFYSISKGKNTDVIHNYAEKYGTNVIETDSGKSLYLSLTKTGLTVRLSDKKGFTTL